MSMSLKRFTATHGNKFFKYYLLHTCTNILCSYNVLNMECVLSTIVLQFFTASYIASTRTLGNDKIQESYKGDKILWCWRWQEEGKGEIYNMKSGGGYSIKRCWSGSCNV